VVFDLGETAVGGVGGHEGGEGPFIVGACVGLVQRGGDEGFEDYEAA
jgi:hypothetical protein